MKKKTLAWLLAAAMLMGHAPFMSAQEDTDLTVTEETVLSDDASSEETDPAPAADDTIPAAQETVTSDITASEDVSDEDPLIIDEEIVTSNEIPAESEAAVSEEKETEDAESEAQTEASAESEPQTEKSTESESQAEETAETELLPEDPSESELQTEAAESETSEDVLLEDDEELLAEEAEETAEEDSQELEASNTIDAATPISFGRTYSGVISDDNTVDYYQFTLPSSGRITFNASAYMKYIYYYLYDGTKKSLWSKNPYWNSTAELSSITETFDLTKGTYYLMMKRDGKANNGNYNFSVSFESAQESFTETGEGTNNSITTANNIAIGTTYRGQLTNKDTKDFYKFTLSTSGELTLDATANLRYIYYYLYDGTGKQIWYANPNWSSTTGQSVKTYTHHLTSGTYYLACAKEGSTGTYSFKFSFVSANETFKETGNGTNNSMPVANGITFDTLYCGQLALNDTKDFYKFSLSSGTTVTLNASAIGMHYIYYTIYNSAGTQQWRKNPSWNSTLGTIESSYDIVLPAGTFYLAVEKDGNYGNYSFTLTRQQMNTPKLLATYNGAHGIGIKWQIEPYADSYEIWRKYQGTWSRIATVSATDSSLQRSGNTLMYTDTTVKSKYGYGYIYSVAAKRGSTATAYNITGLAAYRLAPPVLTEGKNTAAGVARLYWQSTPCHGYQLQYCISSNTSKWTSVKTTTALTQKVTGLKKGKKYYFRIRCFKTNKDRGTTWSEYSPWVSVVIKK